MSSPVSDETLQIYEKIKNKYDTGVIKSYDKRLLLFLDTYGFLGFGKNSVYHILDNLNDCINFDDAPRFTRYVALGMEWEKLGNFHLYEGQLNSLDGRKHCWIETDDSVYDVMFRGKWPKDVYYELFNAEIDKEVDLTSDEDYLLCKKNKHVSMSFFSKSRGELKYVDWYGYETSSDSNKDISTSTFEFSPSVKYNLDLDGYWWADYRKEQRDRKYEMTPEEKEEWRKNFEERLRRAGNRREISESLQSIIAQMNELKSETSPKELGSMLGDSATTIDDSYTPRKK